MIRFACPGCATTFSVDVAKAGKSGRCPKCQSEFVIPDPNADNPFHPPEPSLASIEPMPVVPPPALDTVEIEPCPKCTTRLSIGASDIGSDVECPYCQTIFKAVKPSSRPLAPPPAPLAKSKFDLEDGERKSKRRDDEDANDDRPRRRRRDDDDDDDEERSSRRRKDDDDDDKPEKREKRSRPRRMTGGVMALNHIGVLSAGKVMALLCFVSIVLGMGLSCFMSLLGLSRVAGADPTGAADLAIGAMLVFGLVASVVSLVVGFIYGVILAALYNLVATSVGGLELEFENV